MQHGTKKNDVTIKEKVLDMHVAIA